MKLASRIEDLHSKIKTLKSLASPEAIEFAEQRIRQENEALETQIESLRRKIVERELKFGVIQYKIPVRQAPQPCHKEAITVNEPSKPKEPAVHPLTHAPTAVDKPKKGVPEAEKPKPPTGVKTESKGAGSAGEGPVDVGRLDMRVGRIMEVMRHPGADSLYVEKVDLGEGRLRTVVSGLVKYVPLEALQNRLGIFLCNLKPAKMRDVESEAMLMCASAPEAGGVEPLIIDSDTVTLGDSVVVPGYNHNPDEQLKPKKKIFEQVKPDLRVDQEGFATYKGARWTLKNATGVAIKAEKLRDVQIA